MTLKMAAAVLTFVCADSAADEAPRLKLSMELGLEGRAYPHDPVYPEQDGSGLSLSIEPEIDYAVPRGKLRWVPFGRWDQRDDERTHADVRELSLRQRYGDLDVQAGIGRVFWGVTESVHLVDIVNQTDSVENPDGEDKLGQPLLNLAWTTKIGVFSGFVLPYFRERTLSGEQGRLRAPIAYDRGDAIYESGAERRHVDTALRWSLSRGALDLGVSHFSGTAREPRFVPMQQADAAVLTPVYDLIEQSGLDVNAVYGGWLWKAEAIHQHNRVGNFQAAAGGFEYTFASVRGSSWDVGALSELLWDSRGADSPSAFQKDLFLGTRLAANDVAGTELLAGVIVDLERDGFFGNLEASRRFGPAAKLSVELRLFEQTDPADPLDVFRRDDYVQVEYVYYF
ncbi:MAG: hypothetical protein ACT4QA_02435 [Panacagrimonas sp.]